VTSASQVAKSTLVMTYRTRTIAAARNKVPQIARRLATRSRWSFSRSSQGHGGADDRGEEGVVEGVGELREALLEGAVSRNASSTWTLGSTTKLLQRLHQLTVEPLA
jgi:hypothetical protein